MDATTKRKLRNAVQILAGTYDKDFVEILTCTVDSVDENAFTCACTPISGKGKTSIPGVKLNAEANDGLLIIPAVDSTVIVVTSTRNNYYVLWYSDITKIICIIDGNNSYEFDSSGWIWNGGLFGGMAKTGVLASRYNIIENFCNSIIATKALIAAAAVSSPGTPVTNATLATFFNPITATPLVLTTQTQIEDTKIKH